MCDALVSANFQASRQFPCSQMHQHSHAVLLEQSPRGGMPVYIRKRGYVLISCPRWCVCVCPPLDKGFSTATFSTPFHQLFQPSRGQRDLQSWPLPTKLHTGRSGKRTCAVIPLHSSLLCFDAMVVHVSPPKPFPPQQRCSLSRFVTAVKGNNFCSNTYNFLGLFAMLFHRHPSQRGN